MEEEDVFEKSVKLADFEAISDHLNRDQSLLVRFQDKSRNNVLHLAVLSNNDRVLSFLLNIADQHSNCNVKEVLLKHENNDGKTPLQLATDLGYKSMSWNLIQCGSAAISQKDLLESMTDDRHGNSFLHNFAKYNYASEIKHYAESCSDIEDFIKALSRINSNGDTPLMLAARGGNKEALFALLTPILNAPNPRDVDKLLHHKNIEGHRLIGTAYVSLHPMSLSVIHGLLIQLENWVHGQSAKKVQQCLRESLGSNSSAKFSLNLLKRLQKKPNFFHFFINFVKVFFIHVLLKLFSLLFDIYTDAVLVKEYWDQWYSEWEKEKSHAHDNETEYFPINGNSNESKHIWARGNKASGCDFGEVKGRERFLLTTVIISLPFVLYFFEMLRFRIFSRFLDRCCKKRNTCCSTFAMWIIKPVGNLILWLIWPIFAFCRNAWHLFKFEVSNTDVTKLKKRSTAKNAALISTRVQLIEVCTEASLQPLFQFYLVLKDVICLDPQSFQQGWAIAIKENGKQIWAIAIHGHENQMLSVFVSLITLSFSYTMQYRRNKDNSLSIPMTVIYFVITRTLVTARILNFELFAFYLGPGNFDHFMAAIGCHVILMSCLHFIFSDSLSQLWKSNGQSWTSWIRHVFLVLHNCILNGLANIYVHNNLEILLKSKSPKNSNMEDFDYVASDVQQTTVIRQGLFDLIFLAQNAAMLYLSSKTITEIPKFEEVHLIIVIVVITVNCIGIWLKIVYYLWCHPWSSLIRPRSSCSCSTNVMICSKSLTVKMSARKFLCSVTETEYSSKTINQNANETVELIQKFKIPENEQK